MCCPCPLWLIWIPLWIIVYHFLPEDKKAKVKHILSKLWWWNRQ